MYVMIKTISEAMANWLTDGRKSVLIKQEERDTERQIEILEVYDGY